MIAQDAVMTAIHVQALQSARLSSSSKLLFRDTTNSLMGGGEGRGDGGRGASDRIMFVLPGSKASVRALQSAYQPGPTETSPMDPAAVGH